MTPDKSKVRAWLFRVYMVLALLLMAQIAWAGERPSEVYGYNVERLATAIYHAEGGASTRHPYGILTKYKTTTPRQACINTIRNQAKRHAGHGCGKDYLTCLRDRYCPIGAENDPTGLNVNWLSNVKQLYAKLSGHSIGLGGLRLNDTKTRPTVQNRPLNAGNQGFEA